MAVNPQFIASPLNTFLIVRYVLVTLCWMSHIMWSGNYWNLVNWCVVVIDVSVLKVSSTSGESLWKYDFCHLHWFWKCTLCFWLLSFYAVNAYIALYLYIWLFICCLLAGWWRGSVVERRSLAGELSVSCARPAADGWPLMWVSHPLQVSQLGQLSLSSFRGR